MNDDPRLDYPATSRNREALLEVLRSVLSPEASVLEVASGSGQHARAFVDALDGVRWQPSSYEVHERASVDGWADGHPRIAPAMDLDVRAHPWALPEGSFDAVFCANMAHIAPWPCTPALFEGAARVLRPAGQVLLYGPFDVPWQPLVASNARFDASLRSRDPSWGIRALDDVEAAAAAVGLSLTATHLMPANNLTLVFGATD